MGTDIEPEGDWTGRARTLNASDAPTPFPGCGTSRFCLIFSIRLISAEGAAMETDILTIKEVAEYLRITEKTAYRLASERRIPGFKVGGSWRFRKSEIDEWIEAQKTGSKKAEKP
jgi:excisionase family DNA binding protein